MANSKSMLIGDNQKICRGCNKVRSVDVFDVNTDRCWSCREHELAADLQSEVSQQKGELP